AYKKAPDQVPAIAHAFQQTAIAQLDRNVRRALAEYDVKTLGICGGVAANGALRSALEVAANDAGVDFVVPDKVLCTDNAAMIAAAGWFRFRALPESEQEYSIDQLGFEAQSLAPVG